MCQFLVHFYWQYPELSSVHVGQMKVRVTVRGHEQEDPSLGKECKVIDYWHMVWAFAKNNAELILRSTKYICRWYDKNSRIQEGPSPQNMHSFHANLMFPDTRRLSLSPLSPLVFPWKGAAWGCTHTCVFQIQSWSARRKGGKWFHYWEFEKAHMAKH